MKRFLGTLFPCLVFVEIFFFFGGGLLLDLSRHYYLTGAGIAVLLAVLISVWLAQEKRLEQLEKRIEVLEHPENNKEND